MIRKTITLGVAPVKRASRDMNFAKKQKDRLFGMDFMITHGSAFGAVQRFVQMEESAGIRWRLIIFLCMESIRRVKSLLIISKIRDWKSVPAIIQKN